MKISEIKINPNNPRILKDEKFKKLVKSIKEFPKMMKLRPIVVDNNNIVLGGNMRLRALQELKYKEIPDEWVKNADELTEDEKKRFIIADNVGFGEWDYDLLANEWDENDLSDWGLESHVYNEMPEIIENDFESSKNPNDIYGGNSIPVRIGDLICYVSDEQLCDKIISLTSKINNNLGDGEDSQKLKNKIGEKIITIILDNENIFLEQH